MDVHWCGTRHRITGYKHNGINIRHSILAHNWTWLNVAYRDPQYMRCICFGSVMFKFAASKKSCRSPSLRCEHEPFLQHIWLGKHGTRKRVKRVFASHVQSRKLWQQLWERRPLTIHLYQCLTSSSCIYISVSLLLKKALTEKHRVIWLTKLLVNVCCNARVRLPRMLLWWPIKYKILAFMLDYFVKLLSIVYLRLHPE